ncbi:hypothetical protein [Treponema sp.]|uniref:hypothetical protein n=1 Tax=Treponema sp. TaxID=166 RepID=UPI00298DB285|nr:hypothetical protein [Treponema sp.]
MKKIFLVLASVLVFFFSGCSKEKTIDLKSSDFLSITPDQEWAVIRVPYAAFLEDCDHSARVKTHARSGDVFLVKGKQFVKKSNADENSKRRRKTVDEFETWYRFEEGCLASSLVDIYDTKLKAQTASENLLKKD